MSISLDKVDWAILAALERDSRQSFVTLAEAIGLSKTPCWNRVRTFEKQGFITGYRAVLNPEALGIGLTAYVQVSVAFQKRDAFEVAALSNPIIIACHTTAGDADYLLHIVTNDVAGLDDLLREKLSQLPGVTRLLTILSLRTIKTGGLLVEAARQNESRRLKR